MQLIPTSLKWFTLGLVLSLGVTKAFGGSTELDSSDRVLQINQRARIQSVGRACGWDSKAVQEVSARCANLSNAMLAEALRAHAQKEHAASEALEARGVKLEFVSKLSRCKLTAEDLMSHADSIAIQQAISAALSAITVDEPVVNRVVIETVEPGFVPQVLERLEVHGKTLTLRADLGQCQALASSEERFYLKRDLIAALFGTKR